MARRKAIVARWNLQSNRQKANWATALNTNDRNHGVFLDMTTSDLTAQLLWVRSRKLICFCWRVLCPWWGEIVSLCISALKMHLNGWDVVNQNNRRSARPQNQHAWRGVIHCSNYEVQSLTNMYGFPFILQDPYSLKGSCYMYLHDCGLCFFIWKKNFPKVIRAGVFTLVLYKLRCRPTVTQRTIDHFAQLCLQRALSVILCDITSNMQCGLRRRRDVTT